MFQSPLIACHLSHKASIPHHQTAILYQNNPINPANYSNVIKKSQKLGILNNKGTQRLNELGMPTEISYMASKKGYPNSVFLVHMPNRYMFEAT